MSGWDIMKVSKCGVVLSAKLNTYNDTGMVIEPRVRLAVAVPAGELAGTLIVIHNTVGWVEDRVKVLPAVSCVVVSVKVVPALKAHVEAAVKVALPASTHDPAGKLVKLLMDTMTEAVVVGAIMTWKLSSSFLAQLMEIVLPTLEGTVMSEACTR